MRSTGEDYEKFLKATFEKTYLRPDLVEAMEGYYPD